MIELSDFQKKAVALLPEVELRMGEPMADHTSLRIGGGAEVMAFPKTPEELAHILKVSALLDIVPAILGAGTNILASDEGTPGMVICLKDGLTGMEQLNSCTIRCGAGVTMTRAAVYAAGLGLSGMEFAHGIPGTVGGGVYMNAGAYGGEIGGICRSVEVMDFTGTTTRLDARELGFSYRHSALQDGKQIVLSADFELTPADPEAIRGKMKELMAKRSAAQPLNLPSAGSAFKRPQGGYAAALIDQAGLRGFRVGNAGISEKHTGFAVNLGGATAQDMKNLLQQVSDRVLAMSGIRLEPEIRIWATDEK